MEASTTSLDALRVLLIVEMRARRMLWLNGRLRPNVAIANPVALDERALVRWLCRLVSGTGNKERTHGSYAYILAQ